MKSVLSQLEPARKKQIIAARRRADKARRGNGHLVTCPASRHLHLMADGLLNKGYPMLAEEPEQCAESILAVISALWELRSAARLRDIEAGG